KIGLKNPLVQLVLSGGCIRADQPEFDAEPADRVIVETAAGISDIDGEQPRTGAKTDADRSSGRFAERQSLRRRLDSLANGIADEVHQWLEQSLRQQSLDRRVLSDEFELNILAFTLGHAADSLLQTLEQQRDRLGAQRCELL